VTQHVTADQLKRFRTGGLAGSELLAVDDHITVCESCRNRLTDSHLTYQQMELYVDAELTALEAARVVRHVSECEACRADLADLQQWAVKLKVRPVRKWLWSAAAAAAAVSAVALFAVRPHQPNDPLVTETLRTGQLPFHRRAELFTKRAALSGDQPKESQFHLLSPLGYVVKEARPRLTWQALAQAKSYQVQIFDSSYNLVESSPKIESASWTVAVPLERGKVYSWQVTAFLDRQSVSAPQVPDPEARFEVLDAAGFEALSKTKTAGHLASAIQFASMDLCEDALAEIEALKKENSNPVLAAKLQANAARSCAH